MLPDIDNRSHCEARRAVAMTWQSAAVREAVTAEIDGHL